MLQSRQEHDLSHDFLINDFILWVKWHFFNRIEKRVYFIESFEHLPESSSSDFLIFHEIAFISTMSPVFYQILGMKCGSIKLYLFYHFWGRCKFYQLVLELTL